jgi:hypothetical protein
LAFGIDENVSSSFVSCDGAKGRLRGSYRAAASVAARQRSLLEQIPIGRGSQRHPVGTPTPSLRMQTAATSSARFSSAQISIGAEL